MMLIETRLVRQYLNELAHRMNTKLIKNPKIHRYANKVWFRARALYYRDGGARYMMKWLPIQELQRLNEKKDEV